MEGAPRGREISFLKGEGRMSASRKGTSSLKGEDKTSPRGRYSAPSRAKVKERLEEVDQLPRGHR